MALPVLPTSRTVATASALTPRPTRTTAARAATGAQLARDATRVSAQTTPGELSPAARMTLTVAPEGNAARSSVTGSPMNGRGYAAAIARYAEAAATTGRRDSARTVRSMHRPIPRVVTLTMATSFAFVQKISAAQGPTSVAVLVVRRRHIAVEIVITWFAACRWCC
jgi:hypothetical protein